MPSLPVPDPMTWEDDIVYLDTDYNREIRDSFSFLINRPMFVGEFNGTAISVPTATWTAIPIDTEVIKTDSGMHSNVTNKSRFTVTQEGWWEFVGATEFESSANGTTTRRLTVFRRNGTEFLRPRMDMEPAITAAAAWGKTPIMCIAYCVVGDYVELCLYHESGTGITTGGNAAVPNYLSARWDSKSL